MIRVYIALVILFSVWCAAIAQDVPTIPENRNTEVVNSEPTSDSTTIVSNTFFDIFNGKPGKAAFYGLVIPGGGQIYNRKWWKLPIVYGIEGFLVYNIVSSTSKYNGYQDAYERNLGDEIYVYPENSENGTSDVQILKRNRDKYRKSREYSWAFFLIGHIVTLFEAFIDRHLMEFDISDDLTFQPIMTSIGTYNGFTYTIPLNKKKKIKFKNLLE